MHTAVLLINEDGVRDKRSDFSGLQEPLKEMLGERVTVIAHLITLVESDNPFDVMLSVDVGESALTQRSDMMMQLIRIMRFKIETLNEQGNDSVNQVQIQLVFGLLGRWTAHCAVTEDSAAAIDDGWPWSLKMTDDWMTAGLQELIESSQAPIV